MIKYFSIIVTIFISVSSFAQNLTIATCKFSPTDSTYIISPRYDINDNPCSIVKVFTRGVVGKLKFKGNIIGEVIEEGDNYIIYVLNKTKRINVYHMDYTPSIIDFTQYDDSKTGVEQNKVYYVHIEDNKRNLVSTSNVTYPTGSRILSFSSDNKLKQLVVNDIDWQIVDNSAKRLLPYGKYKYEAIDTEGRCLRGEVELLPAIGSKIVKLNFYNN